MLDNLCLYPVIQDRPADSGGRAHEPLVRFDARHDKDKDRDNENEDACWELGLDGRRRPVSSPMGKPRKKNHTPLATLVCRPGAVAGEFSWWLIPRSPLLSINGVRPLGLAALDPGVLLAHGGNCWLITSQWSPTPGPAPPAVANRECPVCGGELALAPVVQCPCGRYYHLEKPEERDNPALLNCYLSGRCGLCGREPSLEPIFLPEPDEKLLQQEYQR